MADLWLPGFERRPLKAGGAYDDMSNPKLGWHTWEGTSWPAAENAFRPYPPHVGCKPPFVGVPASEVGKRQYVPLNRHAYAFAGSENDDEYVIQVEVAGFAAESFSWPDHVLAWLAHEIVAPIAAATGVPPVVVPQGFHDTRTYRATKPGAYLASSRSEIRLTSAELRAFSGHLGHQHMPPPDTHWDPGALPIDRILDHLEDDMAMTPQERQAFIDDIASEVERRLTDDIGAVNRDDTVRRNSIASLVRRVLGIPLMADPAEQHKADAETGRRIQQAIGE